MRSLTFAGFLLVAAQLVACDVRPMDGQMVGAQESIADTGNNTDLLSVELLPLSTSFGVCTQRQGVWRAELHTQMLGAHFPTDAEITTAGGTKLSISIGKFGLRPGSAVTEASAASPPRRIQIARLDSETTLLVSGFAEGGESRVSIDFDESDADDLAAAMDFANSLVACHLSKRVADKR